MALFQNGEKSALATLEKLQAARRTLEGNLTTAGERLAVLQTTRAEIELTAILDATDPEPARRELIEVQTTIEGLTAARPRLISRIRDAVARLAVARAATVRKSAEKLAARLREHEAELLRLKALLEKFSECPWQPVLTEVTATGTGMVAYNPLIHRLRAELQTQLDIADGVERSGKQAGSGGTATATSLAALLTATQNVESLAPCEGPITAWCQRATLTADALWNRRMLNFPGGAGAREGRATGVPVRGEIQFSLCWNAEGEIDESRSSVVNLENVSGRTAPQVVAAQQRAAAAQGQRISTYMGQ